MYRSLFLSVLLLLAFSGYSQSSVRGVVTDTLHSPVPGCVVTLLTKDNAAIKETNTDMQGAFSFDSLVQGSYMIRARKEGFGAYVSPVIAVGNNEPVDMGAITIVYTGANLDEVAVTAYKPTIVFKNGMVVMNVENNALASGMTVIEMLKMVPGVMFDAQGNITVNGKSGVSFMMNGRLQQMPVKQMLTILSTMSAETIATIELMKNPSAKYDAAGTGGIINIVSKKVKVKGFSGNVMENVSYGKQAGSVTAAMLNFKSDRLTVFTSVNYWYRDIVSEMATDRNIDNAITTGGIHTVQNATNYKRTLNAKAGLEYELTSKWTLGMGVNTAPSSNDIAQTTKTNIGPGLGFGYDHIYNNAYNKETYNNPSGNIYALYIDTNGTQIKFTADYTNFRNAYTGMTRSNFYNNSNAVVSPMLGYRNILDLDFSIATQKLDVTQKLSRTVTMETGLKSSFVDNKSDFTLDRNGAGTDTYYNDSMASNKYNYKERILAAYLNFMKEAGKFSIQAGLRAEQTNIDAVNKTNGFKLHQDYLNLFPNASVNYKMNEKNSMQLTYSYRIDRPGYEQLNPMRVFNDPLNYGTGNPHLRPQYSHNVGVEHTYNSFLTNSFSYTRINNSLYNYSFLDSALIQVDTSVNYAHSDQFTYSLFFQMPVTKWYTIQASGNVIGGTRYGMIQGQNTAISTVFFGGNINNDIMLSKTCKLQINGMYNSPFRDGIQRYKVRASVDVAVQKKFFKTKLSATLQVNDVFFTNIMRCENDLVDQSIYFRQQTDSRRIRLVLNYRFGNMRVDKKVRDVNEEAKRIKKTN